MKFVYVLTSVSDNETEIMGVFATKFLANTYKNDFIREYFAIDEDECSDDELENEVSEYATFTIQQFEVAQ